MCVGDCNLEPSEGTCSFFIGSGEPLMILEQGSSNATVCKLFYELYGISPL